MSKRESGPTQFLPGLEMSTREDDMFSSLAQAGAHKTGVHTGGYSLNDIERCRRIVMDVLSGMSFRQVALKNGCSRNSIRKIYEALEARGELEPLKKRVESDLWWFAATGIQDLQEIADAGRLDPKIQSFTQSQAVTNGQLLGGGATSRQEVRGPGLSEYLDSLKRLKEGSIDV